MWALVLVVLTAAAIYWDFCRSGRDWVEWGTYYMTRVYSQLWHRVSYRGRVPWPRHGRMVLVSNHSCSADPPLLLGTSPRPIGFLVAREHFRINRLFHWYLLRIGCVPVLRDGRDPVSPRQALRKLRAGGMIGVFPESSLAGVGLDRLRPGRHGAAFLALAGEAPVYPVYIAGGPQTHHLLASWVWPSKKAARIYFGGPIDLSAYHGRPRTRAVLEEVTLILMRHIEALKPSPRTGGTPNEPGNRDRADAQEMRVV